MKSLYLFGEPGVGKSSVVRALVEAGPTLIQTSIAGVACSMGPGRRFVLGHYYGNQRLKLEPHPGTDQLSFTVVKWMPGFIENARPDVLIGEGDRLTNGTWFEELRKRSEVCDLVLLDAPEDVTAARREGRRTNQNPTWLRSRRSKVRNLAESHDVHVVDASGSVEQVVEQLLRFASVDAYLSGVEVA